MPLHFMQALYIPKWVVKLVDKTRRNFLWKGHDPCKAINCLVNWERTCALKQNGGLGIIDLHTQNRALLTKWIWKLQHDNRSNWAEALSLLHEIDDISQLGLGVNHSFFLKDLKSLIPFVEVSTEIHQPLGTVVWRWEASGLFSTESTYKMLHNRGINCPFAHRIWKLRTPPKVRVFIWVLLQDKLLTREVLMRRGCPPIFGCLMCGQNIVESSAHLFWDCSYSAAFWWTLMRSMQRRPPSRAIASHVTFWIAHSRPLDKIQKREWDVIWAAALWALWRERNNRFFSQKNKTIRVLLRETIRDIQQWLAYC